MTESDSSPLQDGYVVVVGGGLAGMVAAYELSLRGAKVALFEASDRLGGKAGSDSNPDSFDGALKPRAKGLPGGVASDHGYHIFPKWYVNMRALWARLGIRPEVDVYEGGDYLSLALATGDRMAEFVPEATMSRAELFAMAELALEKDEVVDPLTLQSYLTSRPYLTYAPGSPLNNLVLNALTVGDADLSARAIRNVFRQWIPVLGRKNWDMLRGSLDEKLIAPLASAITQAGGAIHLGHALTGLEVHGDTLLIRIRDRATGSEFEWTGKTILAVPFEVLRDLDTVELFKAGVGLSRLQRVRANPFSAIDVFLARRIPGMPLEHFSLSGSRYGLTGVDIGQHWPALMARDRTVLQFVAGRSAEFVRLDDPTFVEAMRDEIARYLPALRDPANVEAWVPHRNADARLFVNEVGQWDFRLPPTLPQIDNVWFAGDHVQNETDVASMEGAVRSGLVAAEGVRRRLVPATPDVLVLPPITIPGLKIFEGAGGRLIELVLGVLEGRTRG